MCSFPIHSNTLSGDSILAYRTKAGNCSFGNSLEDQNQAARRDKVWVENEIVRLFGLKTPANFINKRTC